MCNHKIAQWLWSKKKLLAVKHVCWGALNKHFGFRASHQGFNIHSIGNGITNVFHLWRRAREVYFNVFVSKNSENSYIFSASGKKSYYVCGAGFNNK